MSALTDHFRDLGAGLSRFTERWAPDSWVICMMLTACALALAVLGAGVGIEDAVLAWGGGMWNLLELAMQFTIIMVASHACVSSRPVYRLMDRLARTPNPEKPLQAIALAAGFSLVTAYLNWAFCLVASALFVPFVCRHNPKTDIRVLIAAAYLGLGTVWHCGLSGSAPLILATPGNPLITPAEGEPVLERLIPVTETLFATFNLGYMVVIAAAGVLAVLALHPRRGAIRSLRRADRSDSSESARGAVKSGYAGRANGPFSRLDSFSRCADRLSLGPLDADPGVRHDLDDQRL